MSSESNTTRKRVRTGCFKCRDRRRKCDEEKPQCRRCRLGGFTCQYGTRLSFLDKNAFTTPQTPDAPPATTNGNGFRGVQFVNPRSSDSGRGEQEQPSTIVTSGSPRVIERQTLHDPQPLPTPTSPVHAFNFDFSAQTPSFSFPGVTSPEAISPSQSLPQDIIPALHTETSETSPGTHAYETALDVLLSLRATPKSLQASISSDKARSLSISDIVGVPESFKTCRHGPQDPKVRLLRHYVYNIAPWLDTGDPDQAFRLQVGRLSLVVPAVMDAILLLSSRALLARTLPNQEGLHESQEYQEIMPSTSLDALVAVMTRVGDYMVTDPLSWRPIIAGLLSSDIDMMSTAENLVGLDMAISWLVLRLNLSRGLIHEQSIAIPELLLHGVTSPSSRGWPRDLLSYDRQPLLLCARALNYRFGLYTSNSLSVVPQNKVDAWKDIFNSLVLWHANRPQDFKPIVELESRTRLFPLLLFTNRAAIMANQMYHTAMLLLLQHRPRTLAVEVGPWTGMSPLRHAQMICGLSVDNDESKSWDFPLVASFYLAAKGMTYVPQQDAIADKIERVAAMTGWNLNTIVPALRRTWHPVG